MAVSSRLVGNSAAARWNHPVVRGQLVELAGSLHVYPVDRLYSDRSARDYDAHLNELTETFAFVSTPADIFERTLRLQRDLAHHHGLWHRIPIPDLLIAETALFHDSGVLHVDGDFERIAAVWPLVLRRLG